MSNPVNKAKERLPFDLGKLDHLKHILRTIKMDDQVELLEELETAFGGACESRDQAVDELRLLKTTFKEPGALGRWGITDKFVSASQ